MGFEAFHRPGQKTFGPWGNHTSSLDWCEDNYTHSTHIAEFYNTLSNIPFILLGLWGMYTASKLNTPAKLRIMFAQSFISIIGVGSFIFHGTLLWHAQVMLDELPMIWSGAVFMYLTLVGGKEHGSAGLKAAVAIVPVGVTWLYLRYPYPVLHQVAYASIQAITIPGVMRLLKEIPTITASQARKRQECKSNLFKGIGTFLLGFAIWNIDNILCEGLTGLRQGRGEWVNMLTQGHAWWHLLTGIGASRIIMALTHLTLSIHRPDDFEFGYILGLPYVRHVQQPRRIVVEKDS
ncbi:hypothetical protein M407DRAFT_243175 [Tulasnella calospora MUT 4182]|uniref:Alkaline phytoceramidase n=1 Tax=Tulasnella calospora MUT 4182 TaxID=1051891 RepID=A0A0C3QKP4_9AGAM|nr:hypothetical protein M407DRAFT_243175 [Tulasnella calospora MUT 4182]